MGQIVSWRENWGGKRNKSKVGEGRGEKTGKGQKEFYFVVLPLSLHPSAASPNLN